MGKYSFELKKKIVLEYLEGRDSQNGLTKKYGVSNKSQVLKWVHAYQSSGDAGLKRSREMNTYSFEYKLSIVESYLAGEFSYSELADREHINNPCIIASWVKAYRDNGPDGLRPRKRGRRKSVSSKPDKTHVDLAGSDERLINTSTEHVKQLEDEVLKLRIENAYLKELRRLRLEKEIPLRKKRESSTASEESSN